MLPPRPEAVERYLAVLRALRFVQEEPRGSNAGQPVEAIQEVTGNKRGDPWCASLVAYAGESAFGPDWPLPKTASCQTLYQFGKDKGLLVDTPAPGDLLLIWYPTLRRMAHVCTVEVVNTPTVVQTIDGNSNNDGSREGWGWVRKTRHLKAQDALLRWV